MVSLKIKNQDCGPFQKILLLLFDEPGDGVEGEAGEAFLLRSEPLQLVCDLDFVQVFVLAAGDLVLEPEDVVD